MKKIMILAPLAALLALTSACQPLTLHASNCSNGQCVTTNATVGPAGSQYKTPVPTRSAPQPETTASAETAQPSIPGATQPAPDPTQAVTTCLGPDPSREVLVQLASYNSREQKNLTACLVIPDSLVRVFMQLLAQDAANALNNGDFDSEQGRQGFAQGTLASDAQRCHAGQS